MSKKLQLAAPEPVEPLLRVVRSERVILDANLARLYGVETKALNRSVKRNANRFPRDFAFQLSRDEADSLRFQFGTLKSGRGQHRKYLPHVFTEHGAIMVANVLTWHGHPRPAATAGAQAASNRILRRRRQDEVTS